MQNSNHHATSVRLSKPSYDAVLAWLMEGDISIQYQTMQDLFDEDRRDLRARIAKEGWGKQYLDCKNPKGFWGQAFYQPKWTSTHYTLLELKKLAMAPDTPGLYEIIRGIAARNVADDGGLGTTPNTKKSDVCVNGMFLNYACYFGIPEPDICSVVDFLLSQKMQDGGLNCMSNRSGAHHSSLHSTLSVLEGILQYNRAGHTYRLGELEDVAESSREFVLKHRFFKSDRTGKIINPDFLKIPYPPRWRYNILRALDYFRDANIPFDARMGDALEALIAKRRPDGRWPRQAALPGKTFFEMEPPRGPSRWNTCLALRVLKTYQEHLN